MINEILWNLINNGEVASLINDIIVGTEEKKGHDEVVEKIIEEIVKRLVENDLYIKLEKCKQKIREVGFLRVVIRPEEIKIEEEKVKRVLKWPTLKGVKDIQKFLELANYYQQFIKDFVMIARLLHNLVKKNQKWDWTEKQKKVFQELKERFTKELVLAVSDLDKKIRIKVDISDYAIKEYYLWNIKTENRGLQLSFQNL